MGTEKKGGRCPETLPLKRNIDGKSLDEYGVDGARQREIVGWSRVTVSGRVGCYGVKTEYTILAHH